MKVCKQIDREYRHNTSVRTRLCVMINFSTLDHHLSLQINNTLRNINTKNRPGKAKNKLKSPIANSASTNSI